MAIPIVQSICSFCQKPFILSRDQYYKTKRPHFCSRKCIYKGLYQKTSEERFWEKVLKTDSNLCWEWQAARYSNNYGSFDGALAHRIAWKLAKGKIPPKLFVCHKCDNPPCCNPDHLFLGTAKQNSDDMFSKNRQGERRKKDICENGHPVTGTNLFKIKHKKKGYYKTCKQCYYEKRRLKRLKKKLQIIS